MPTVVPLEAPRLRLRAPVLDDAAAAVAAYGSDPEVSRSVSWPRHRSIEDAHAFLRYAIAAAEEGREPIWAIVERATWGRGFATEAAAAVVAWALAQGDIYRVWAVCDVENVASARVLEKVGLEREGRLRGWAVMPSRGPLPRLLVLRPPEVAPLCFRQFSRARRGGRGRSSNVRGEPMTDDRERLEQYLEWRRTFDRERAARRRRVLASAAIVGVIVVGVGLAGWLARRPTPTRVATVRPLGTPPPEVRPPAVERPSSLPPLSDPAPVEPPPREPRATRDARPRGGPVTRARSTAGTRSPSTPVTPSVPQPSDSIREAPRPSTVPSPAAEHDADSDVAAAVAARPPSAPEVTEVQPQAPAAQPEASATRPAHVPPQPAAPAPPADAVAQQTPAPRDAPSAAPEAKVSDRVARWLKGEVQEFRDGVKREIGEFRSGYEKVRGAVLKLGRDRSAER